MYTLAISDCTCGVEWCCAFAVSGFRMPCVGSVNQGSNVVYYGFAVFLRCLLFRVVFS